MQITMKQLLGKMDMELQLAKQTTNRNELKEKLIAIKVLSELALEMESTSLNKVNDNSFVELDSEEEETIPKNQSLLDF